MSAYIQTQNALIIFSEFLGFIEKQVTDITESEGGES